MPDPGTPALLDAWPWLVVATALAFVILWLAEPHGDLSRGLAFVLAVTRRARMTGGLRWNPYPGKAGSLPPRWKLALAEDVAVRLTWRRESLVAALTRAGEAGERRDLEAYRREFILAHRILDAFEGDVRAALNEEGGAEYLALIDGTRAALAAAPMIPEAPHEP